TSFQFGPDKISQKHHSVLTDGANDIGPFVHTSQGSYFNRLRSNYRSFSDMVVVGAVPPSSYSAADPSVAPLRKASIPIVTGTDANFYRVLAVPYASSLHGISRVDVLRLATVLAVP
ncbi:hypothetical protein R3P38DRAFT_3118858, partial [Favolaschia claudopus]